MELSRSKPLTSFEADLLDLIDELLTEFNIVAADAGCASWGAARIEEFKNKLDEMLSDETLISGYYMGEGT